MNLLRTNTIFQVFSHPVLRSTLIVSFSLLFGMTGMTWFATQLSSDQAEINERVEAIVQLKIC